MQTVVEALKRALSEIGTCQDDLNAKLVGALQKDSPYLWEANFPIAIVHTKDRVKDQKIVSAFERKNLFDDLGVTPTHYDEHTLEYLHDVAAEYLQCAALICMTKSPEYPREFLNKYPKDYWKKFQDIDNVKAIVEQASFGEDVSECTVEFVLRDVMRKRKEVSVLKGVGYVWIAEVSKDVDLTKVFQHYFLDNRAVVAVGDKSFYIGWSEKLKDINMRYFVCPPE